MTTRSAGAVEISCPGRWAAKSSIQVTETINWNTCQKQAKIPIRKTNPIKPFSQILARNTSETAGKTSQPPVPTSAMTASIATICRTGWVNSAGPRAGLSDGDFTRGCPLPVLPAGPQ
jgi:hypothetical protein